MRGAFASVEMLKALSIEMLDNVIMCCIFEIRQLFVWGDSLADYAHGGECWERYSSEIGVEGSQEV